MRVRAVPLLAVLLPLLSTAPALAQNRSCIPLFLDGRTGDSVWETEVTLTPTTLRPNQGTVRLVGSDGRLFGSFDIRFNGHRLGLREALRLNPLRLRTSLDLFGDDPARSFQSGFVVVESTEPFSLTASFRQIEVTSQFIREATVRSIEPLRRVELFAEEIERWFNGLAIANPDPINPVSGVLEFTHAGQNHPFFRLPLTLGPLTQDSRFLMEFFPGIGRGTRGTVRMTFDRPVCAMALRTDGASLEPQTIKPGE